MINRDDQDGPADPEGRARFRRTLTRVMTVQVISLILLWLLQRHYAS